jgi:hypothetical protein
MRTPVNEAGSQGQAAEHLETDYNLAAALCERLRHGSIAPFIPLRIEVTT